MVDVAVVAELLLLPLHTFFHFLILTVGGNGVGLSMGSYDNSGVFLPPVSCCSQLNNLDPKHIFVHSSLLS